MRKNAIKIEFATIQSLIKDAENGKKLYTKTKIAINDFKSKAKEVGDLIDFFENGPYYDVVVQGQKLIDDAKKLGLENSPEIKQLLGLQKSLTEMKKILGDSNEYKRLLR